MHIVRLSFEGHFSSAHFLPGYDGECANEHGHRWDVAVQITAYADNLPESGILVDFHALEAVVKKLDHKVLNDVHGLENPTCENVAGWLYADIDRLVLGTRGPTSLAVTVWESPECSITMEGSRE